MKSQHGPGRQDYATPQAFVNGACEALLGGRPEIDLAATADNAKAPRFVTDFLGFESTYPFRWWMNPPFRSMRTWAPTLCRVSRYLGPGLLLIPADLQTRYYREHLRYYARTIILDYRLAFEGQTHGFDRPLMLLHFDRENIGTYDRNRYYYINEQFEVYETLTHL